MLATNSPTTLTTDKPDRPESASRRAITQAQQQTLADKNKRRTRKPTERLDRKEGDEEGTCNQLILRLLTVSFSAIGRQRNWEIHLC